MSAADDIHDIRGPKSVLEAGWPLTVAVGIALVVALCLFILWRRRRNRPTATPQRILTLTEQTLAALENTKPLMRPETAREFGIAASEVIRTYIERRFQLIATQRTTEEFLQTLLQSSNEALSRHRTLLEQFLSQCDLVKFAGTSLAPAELETLYQSAHRFVSQTGA